MNTGLACYSNVFNILARLLQSSKQFFLWLVRRNNQLLSLKVSFDLVSWNSQMQQKFKYINNTELFFINKIVHASIQGNSSLIPTESFFALKNSI